MTERLMLAIDGSNWVHRAYHIPSTLRHHGAAIFCQMLEKADRTFGPSHLVVAFDHPAPTWRHRLYPAYKAGRPPKPDDLVEQLDLSAKAAAAYGCQVFCIEGVEADDIIATVATRATAAQVPTIVGSSDKDLAQLADDHVSILDPEYRLVGPVDVELKWGVRPGKLRDVLALMGDSADGIPGVDGIGPSTAAALVAKYGSAMAAVEHASEVGGKRGASLAKSAELVTLGLSLLDLRCDVELGSWLTSTKRTPEAWAEFRKKLNGPEVSMSVKCYGICEGVPGYVDPETGRACTLCGGGGKVTTYNSMRQAEEDWNAVRK